MKKLHIISNCAEHAYRVSVRCHCSAGRRESSIVSTTDSGHYGFSDGASYQAALDKRREAFDLFSDNGTGHISCASSASLCDECEPDFQMASRPALHAGTRPNNHAIHSAAVGARASIARTLRQSNPSKRASNWA